MVGKYRLRQATLVVITLNRLAKMLPLGSIVEVQSEPGEGNRLMDVLIEGGTPAMMFVIDLRSRGERINEAGLR